MIVTSIEGIVAVVGGRDRIRKDLNVPSPIRKLLSERAAHQRSPRPLCPQHVVRSRGRC